jgi:hypothetical protein
MFLKIMSILSAVSGTLALLTVGLIVGAQMSPENLKEGGGMVLVAFSLYTVIFVIIALICGFISYFTANRAQTALPLMAKLGIGFGGVAGIILTVMMALS